MLDGFYNSTILRVARELITLVVERGSNRQARHSTQSRFGLGGEARQNNKTAKSLPSNMYILMSKGLEKAQRGWHNQRARMLGGVSKLLACAGILNP
jgi:hypothetical protein